MTIETLEYLQKLREQYGREFGKLCQKLLALAFRGAGYTVMEERGVQGVDIDIAGQGERFSVEVKTTDGEAVSYVRKDAEGLAARQRDGYQPVLAVLQIKLFAEWLFVKADRLTPGQLAVERLRAYRMRDLEERIASGFDEVVETHFSGALEGGQTYLDTILREDAGG